MVEFVIAVCEFLGLAAAVAICVVLLLISLEKVKV